MGLNLSISIRFIKKILIVTSIISFAFFLSVLINSYIALSNFAVSENIEVPFKQDSKSTTAKAYSSIKDIFIQTEESLTTGVKSKEKQSNQIYNIDNIKLVGTIIFNKKRVALIEKDKESYLVAVNDTIDGYKVNKVNKDAVYLEKNGKIYKITLSLSRIATKSNYRKTTTNTLQTEEKSVIKLSRGLVEKETADIGNLLKDVRLVPIVKNGETVGFKFTYINPRSLLYKYGLRTGDLIKSVNGMPVRTAEEAFKIYNMLRNENNIQLEIERNGKRKVIVYEIQ